MTADTAVIDCYPDTTFPSSGTLGADFLFYQSGEMLMDSVVVALLFYVHGKHLRSCRDGQLT